LHKLPPSGKPSRSSVTTSAESLDMIFNNFRIVRLFRRAMRSFLRERKNKGITEALNAVYGNENERLGLDPVLEHFQGASIVREDW
jgi:hypothetical protein